MNDFSVPLQCENDGFFITTVLEADLTAVLYEVPRSAYLTFKCPKCAKQQFRRVAGMDDAYTISQMRNLIPKRCVWMKPLGYRPSGLSIDDLIDFGLTDEKNIAEGIDGGA